jgi:hypothetical protein
MVYGFLVNGIPLTFLQLILNQGTISTCWKYEMLRFAQDDHAGQPGILQEAHLTGNI